MTTLPGAPYEALYAEHQPAARRLARTLVPADAADDIVSEAFTKVLAVISRNGARASFRPYLMAAVRNEAASFHARRRRLVLGLIPEPDPAPGPERELVRAEEVRLALRAYQQLLPRWRWVLWETAVNERSVSELAAQTGMAPGTVSQLASRAREGLRQRYLRLHAGTAADPACQAVAPYMGAAVRGHAGQRNQAKLREHLAGCERCRAVADELTRINTRLGEVLVPVAGAGAALARVMPAIRRTARIKVRHLPRASTAVLVTAAGLGTLVYLWPASPGSAPQRPARVPASVPRTHVPVPAAGSTGYAPRHRRPGAEVGAVSAVPMPAATPAAG